MQSGLKCAAGTMGGGDAMGFSYRKSVKMGPFRAIFLPRTPAKRHSGSYRQALNPRPS
jgi:hypothetical protein